MGIGSKITKFFVGKVAGSMTDTASEVADIVQRWKPSEADKVAFEKDISKVINDATDSARKMALASHNTWFDVLIDGINRAIRPGVTIWIIGGLIGWWALPAPGTIDPFFLKIFWTIIGFWFGGRAVLKDLPKAVQFVRNIK